MSSRYSPHVVWSTSAPSESRSYERVRDSRSAQGGGVTATVVAIAAAAGEGGASEELEEAVVPDFGSRVSQNRGYDSTYS